MIKIPKNKKFRHLPDYMQEHLSFLPPEEIKTYILFYCLLFIDLCFLPSLYPVHLLVYSVTLPLLFFVHLWLIRLLIKNPFTTQMESTLFFAVSSFIGVICYLVMTIKVTAISMEVTSFWFYSILLLFHIITITKLIHYQVNKYSKIDYNLIEEEKWYNSSRLLPILVAGPALGYIIVQVFNDNQQGLNIMLFFLSTSMTIILSYFSSKYIHKYFFMKKNIDFVSPSKPTEKKKRKEYEKKGVVYK
ncbi:hypothetical protein JI666_20065 [Bacillus sp. NTK071]|uniref:hypothetical protein n=1 Tax=Bacillus sp. NTK071 TaxID=2802175 RepID=UPI001A8D4D10|nr:hypothetical protein [Bacillus sp. NTK071]MBN8211040.1 hypothetical protein [Bacillus sp. NTK071]